MNSAPQEFPMFSNIDELDERSPEESSSVCNSPDGSSHHHSGNRQSGHQQRTAGQRTAGQQLAARENIVFSPPAGFEGATEATSAAATQQTTAPPPAAIAIPSAHSQEQPQEQTQVPNLLSKDPDMPQAMQANQGGMEGNGNQAPPAATATTSVPPAATSGLTQFPGGSGGQPRPQSAGKLRQLDVPSLTHANHKHGGGKDNDANPMTPAGTATSPSSHKPRESDNQFGMSVTSVIRNTKSVGVRRARDADNLKNTALLQNRVKSSNNLNMNRTLTSTVELDYSSLLSGQTNSEAQQSTTTNVGDKDCPFPEGNSSTSPQHAGPSHQQSHQQQPKVAAKPVTLAELKLKIKHGQRPPPGFGLFGSFERSRVFNELVTLCQDDDTKQFVKYVVNGVYAGTEDAQMAENICGWIDKTKAPASESFYAQPNNAWPLHTCVSLACYYQSATSISFAGMIEMFRRGGLISTGKGFLAAVAVASSRSKEQFRQQSILAIKIAQAIGSLYQRHAESVNALTEPCANPSFLLLLVNIPISALQLLLAEVNAVNLDDPQHKIPLSEIQICRVISLRSCVVCGHPLDLMRLDMLLVQYTSDTGVKVHKDFLPSIVPENSPHYNQQLRLELLHVLKEEDLCINIEDFVCTLFSPVNGEEMNENRHFMMDLAGIVTCVPQDLTYSLQHLRETDTVYDFSAAELRIGQMIAWAKKSICVIAAPIDKVEASALPSPRRSSQRHVIRSTLAKCAILNDIFKNLSYIGKPKVACLSSLQTTFVELGLMLDLDIVFDKLNNSSSNNNSNKTGVMAEVDQLLSPNNFSINKKALFGHSVTSFGGSTHSPPSQKMTNKMFSMSLSTITAYVEPAGVSEVESKAYHASQRNIIVMPPTHGGRIVNMYQVSPLIRYLELQHRCLLTQGAVDFAQILQEKTNLPFPKYTLLMSPTVFALLELWDAYEFVSNLQQERENKAKDKGKESHQQEWKSQAEIRKAQLKRMFNEIHSLGGQGGGNSQIGQVAAMIQAQGMKSPVEGTLSPKAE